MSREERLAQHIDSTTAGVFVGRQSEMNLGRVSDVHFGLVTLHDRVGVTAEAQYRHEYHVALLLQKASSMAWRMVKCTSETRPHFLPAHCGPQLKPIAGFWRVLKDCMGAERCCANLPLFYHRTRQVLMAHHERPIYELHW